ncbi:hypothetical protein ACOSP7_032788 [Xanthoceras sorbifolium]
MAMPSSTATQALSFLKFLKDKSLLKTLDSLPVRCLHFVSGLSPSIPEHQFLSRSSYLSAPGNPRLGALFKFFFLVS